jgi:hypothetical protein
MGLRERDGVMDGAYILNIHCVPRTCTEAESATWMRSCMDRRRSAPSPVLLPHGSALSLRSESDHVVARVARPDRRTTRCTRRRERRMISILGQRASTHGWRSSAIKLRAIIAGRTRPNG